MSLHVLADHMASKGRNGDSMLVHMTPGEVAGLHALAAKHGGQLTINPDTGLPEANFLKSLLPMIAGFALGPAGFGLMSAGMAGLTVGGITALSTGSLSRGLMAGMGAYGGAGLGEALAGAGEGALSSQISGEIARDKAAEIAAGQLGEEEVGKMVSQRLADTSGLSKVGAGFNAITQSPATAMQFAKQNVMPLSAAAAPIAADMMVPTTTKMPTNTNPAYIRQYVTGDRPQAPRALAPVLASEWGARSFSDAYKPMATGGIVALADGGAVQHFDIGGEAKTALEEAYAKNDVDAINKIVSENKITAADVGKTWEGFDTSGIKGLQLYTPPTDQAAAPTYNQYSNEQIASYLATNPNADIAAAIKTTNADPAAVNAYLASLDNPFRGSTDTTGGSGTLGIYNQMKALGIDANELYAANKAFDPNYAGWSAADIARGYNLDKGAYALSSQLGGNVSDKNWAKFMDDNGYSINDMAQAFGLSRNEVKARYDAAKKEEKKTTVTGTGGGGGGTTTPTRVTDTVLPTNPTVNAPPGTRNPYGNVNNPGDLTFNNDGTITVQPNIPGRPYGGFSGMDEVKNAYTAGGGSLGYTPYVPKTAVEHDKLYNKQTGDSLAAYNYLIGKGSYPTKSGVSEIMKPYEEAVLGYPTDITRKKYINVNGKMVLNPDYKPPVSLTAKVDDPNKPPTTTARTGYQWGWNPTTKKWEEMPISNGTGMEDSSTGGQAAGGLQQSYAEGGITGNGNLDLHIPLNIGGGGGGYSGGSFNWGSSGTSNAVNPNSGVGGTSTTQTLPAFDGTSATPAYDPRSGGATLFTEPAIGYSPFSEEGRRKMAEAAATAQGVPATGPISGGDYTGSNNSSADMAALAKRLGIGMAGGGMAYAVGGGLGSLGSYSDGGRLLKGPGDGVSDSIPATIGRKQQPARLADGEFVVPARIVSELGNGSTEAGAKKLYAMMDRVQRARGKTTGKNKVAANSRADKYLPA